MNATFEELEAFLRRWTNIRGAPVDYDFVGGFTLFAAILANLADHAMTVDLEGLAESDFRLNCQQRKFLETLLAKCG